MEHILNNIRRQREAKGLTQAEMGQRLGISRVQYSNLESKGSGLNIERIQEIGKVLGVGTDVLMRDPEATVVSFVNRKGGVGKSTMTALFSTAYAAWTNRKVLVIDADSQATIAKMAQEEGNPLMDVVAFNFDESHTPIRDFLKLVERESKKYDMIFIDTQGSFSDGQATNTVLSISDICIIPIQATKPAVQSTLTTLISLPEIAAARQQEGKSFLPLGIVNQKTRTNEHKIIQDLDGQFGMKVLQGALSNLVRYHRDMKLSQPICGQHDDDEFAALFAELTQIVG